MEMATTLMGWFFRQRTGIITIGQGAIVQLILLMGQEVVVGLMVAIMSIQMDLTIKG